MSNQIGAGEGGGHRRWVAPILILLSCTATQASAALAYPAFAHVGPLAVTSLRFEIAGLSLLLIARPKFSSMTSQQWKAMCWFALSIAMMNAAFYQAVDRLPLGTATAVEFCGPFVIAVVGSVAWKEIFWVVLPALGVVLLTRPGGSVSLVGLGFAAIAGCGWAGYTVLSKRVGSVTRGWDGLALSVSLAGLLLAPVTLVHLSTYSLSDVGHITASALVGVTLAFSLEMTALRLSSARVVSVLFSIDPVVAFLIGATMLSQPIELVSLIGACCIVAASVAVSLHQRSPTTVPLPPGG